MTSHISTFEEYQQVYQHSITDPEGFWAEQAATFRWKKQWNKVVKWNFKSPDIKWFIGGKCVWLVWIWSTSYCVFGQ